MSPDAGPGANPDAGPGADPGANPGASSPIRIGIVDDHPVVGQGTAAILARQEGLAISGVAETLEAAEARGLTDSARVDVLLLDLRLGEASGLRLLSAARDAGRRLPAVIVLTAYDYPQYADAALGLGAAGFVLKTAPIAELVDAIRRVAAGGLAFAVRPQRGVPIRLSDREQTVIRLVAEGRSNDEIGATLGIASKTVETHLSRLFERYGIGSRAELAARAIREGWLDLPALR